MIEITSNSEYEAAKALFDGGNFEKAISRLHSAVIQFPKDANLLSLLAHCYILDKRLDDAAVCLSSAKELDPSNPLIYCNEVRFLIQKNLPQALSHAINLVQSFPDNVEAMILLGSCLRLHKKYDEGLIYLENAIVLNPRSAEALVNRGLIFLAIGEKYKAQNDLESAFKIKPHLTQIISVIVSLKIELKEFDGAIRFLLSQLNNDPINENYLMQLGFCYEHKSDFENARLFYDKVINLNSGNIDALKRLGSILIKNGKLNEAAGYFKKILKKEPSNHAILNNLGVICRGNGDIGQAIDYYSQAIKCKADYAEAHNNLGNALQVYGRLDDAILSYKNAIKASPQYAEALNNLGVALKEKKEYQAAISAHKQAGSIKHNYAENHVNLGNVLLQISNIDDAIKEFNTAITLQPTYSTAFASLAEAYKKQGDLEKAFHYFDKVDSEEARAKTIECAYKLKKYDEFNQRLKKLSSRGSSNIRVAAISAFAAQQLEQTDIYPFCKDPLSFIKMSNISKHTENCNSFLAKLLQQLYQENSIWEPENKSTRKGFQTNERLFFKPNDNLAVVKKIVVKELKEYRANFDGVSNGLVNFWPNDYDFSAWFVRIIKEGFQDDHIHPAGWVSGVIYLKTVQNPKDKEGAIKFGLHGYDYPIVNSELPVLLHQPIDGDIVLFPSSLFHGTIPVKQDTERCVIAFDLLPSRQ